MRTLSRNLARLVAAATLAAAAGLALPTTPASAATCSSGEGVSVVVDFHELGGGVRTACVVDGGGQTASSLFPAAGFPLSYVQRQPGFVCRVSGVPADDPCVNTPPADAYWGLWWSDGTSGSWTYATTGAGGLTVPEGGYVAFSWNGSSARSMPGVSPAKHAPAPTPAPTPTHEPSSPTPQPTHTGSTEQPPTTPSGSSDGPGSPSPTGGSTTSSDGPAPGQERSGTTKSGEPDERGSASPDEPTAPTSSEPSDEPTDELAPAASDFTDPNDGGLPPSVAPAVIAVLFGVAGGAAVVRRRRGTPGP